MKVAEPHRWCHLSILERRDIPTRQLLRLLALIDEKNQINKERHRLACKGLATKSTIKKHHIQKGNYTAQIKQLIRQINSMLDANMDSIATKTNIGGCDGTTFLVPKYYHSKWVHEEHNCLDKCFPDDALVRKVAYDKLVLDNEIDKMLQSP